MDPLQALIYGVVEGLTEFLPVSSTGHLILTERLLGTPKSDFLDSFRIIIQLGAILSVVALYGKRLLVDRAVLGRVLVAFVPTGILGLALSKLHVIKWMQDRPIITLTSLAVGGLAIIAFELWHREDESADEDVGRIPWKVCIGIGLFQSLALVPGVSRSAATILGGMALGLKRRTVVEFSFLLAVPTMLAATAYELLKQYKNLSVDQATSLGVGFVVSFVVALLTVKFLLHYVRNHTFVPFGVYRIIAAGLFWWLVLGGGVSSGDTPVESHPN